MTKYFTKEGDDYKEVEGELLDQSAVDKIVKDRAERVARQNYGDYEDLKKKAGSYDGLKSEMDTKVGDLTKERDSAKLEVEKVKIVHEFKLPEELHEFVTAENADEMRQRAEKLSKGVKPDKVIIDKKKKPDEDKSTDSKTLAGKLFGKKSD